MGGFASTIYDPDGPGPRPPELVVGGFFPTPNYPPTVDDSIATWNGQRWSPFIQNVGRLGPQVYAVTVFNDHLGPGGGPSLYAGGSFTQAGPNQNIRGLARWTGTQWAAVGGFNLTTLSAMTVFDDGTGPALYVGGNWGSGPVRKWDGQAWSVVGGSQLAGGQVYALTTFDDDGDGPHQPVLVAGGQFSAPGANIAVWNGAAWSPLGTGANGAVRALTTFDDDGPGPHPPALIAGGSFTTAGGVSASRIAAWSGGAWSALGPGLTGLSSTTCEALLADQAATPPRLYVGGSFTSAGPAASHDVAMWSGGSWQAMGTGASGGSDHVLSFAMYDDGRGPSLFATGNFANMDGALVNGIAHWDGTHWHQVGGSPALGDQMVVASFGVGPAMDLYAAGIGGLMKRTPEWTWVGQTDAPISALSTQPRPQDPATLDLYAAGRFTTIGGVPAAGVARYDGQAWMALAGGGLGSSVGGAWGVTTITRYRPPGAPADLLIFAGSFDRAGGQVANHIAAWDGAAWLTLGAGLNGPVNDAVVFDDGAGPALYVGGNFTQAGGVAALSVAKWDGSAWSPLGSGLTGPTTPGVWSLAVFDEDGPGPMPPALYAGGFFSSSGAVGGLTNVARWSGSSWQSVGGGLNSVVYGLRVFDDDGPGGPRQPCLFAGGDFGAHGDNTGPLPHLACLQNGLWVAVTTVPSAVVPTHIGAMSVVRPDQAHQPWLFASGRFTNGALNLGARSGCTGCAADFDSSGAVDPLDIADFIQVWIASMAGAGAGADFDGDGAVAPPDVAGFVSSWFAALQNGC